MSKKGAPHPPSTSTGSPWAGAHFVRLSEKLYEALKALGEHRPRLDLYHSALQIWLPDD